MLSCSQHARISSSSHSCSLLQEIGQKENFQLGTPIKQSAGKMAKWPPALTMLPLQPGWQQSVASSFYHYDLQKSLIPASHLLAASELLPVHHPSFPKSWGQKYANIFPVPPCGWQFGGGWSLTLPTWTFPWKMEVSGDRPQRFLLCSEFHCVGFWS